MQVLRGQNYIANLFGADHFLLIMLPQDTVWNLWAHSEPQIQLLPLPIHTFRILQADSEAH